VARREGPRCPVQISEQERLHRSREGGRDGPTHPPGSRTRVCRSRRLGLVIPDLPEERTPETAEDGRPSVLIYAGDFHPSGVLIGDQFTGKAGLNQVIRVGLNIDEVAAMPHNSFPMDKKKP
jgi:hypothetical protein